MAWLLRAFRTVYRLSQWTRRRFTVAGMALVYLLSASAVFGVDTQRTAAFQLFALALALLAVAALTNARFRPRVALERRLPEFATVDEPFRYRQLVHNRGPKRLAGIRLRDELAEHFPDADTFRSARDAAGNETVNWVDRRVGYPRWLELVRRGRGAEIQDAAVPDVPPGGTAEVAVAVTPVRRGPLRFERCRLLRADVLGLVNACIQVELAGELLVLPRCYPVPPMRLPGTRRLQRGGVALSHNVGDSQEFTQLRDYRPGDPLRHVHWPSFAKVGALVVKEYHDEYFTRHALVLDTFARAVDAPALEAAVSVAASFVAAMQMHDALLDLVFVEDRAYRLTVGRGLGRGTDLLRELAAIGPARSQGFEPLAAQVLEHAAALSGCILVLLDFDDARRKLVQALRAVGVRQLVIVIGEPREAELDVPIYPIDRDDVGGSLARLPQVW